MRRIEVSSGVYQVRPSFVMPYMIGKTNEVGKGLDMYRSGTSFEDVARILGRNEMYWYRAFCSIGRNSVIGTTVKKPENIPVNLAADEKHTKWMGEKVYLTSTVAKGCILGSSLSSNADESGLTRAYGEFMTEAREINPYYLPKSVNTDGWKATKKAWKELCPGTSLVLCFFHQAKKIKDAAKKIPEKQELMKKVWNCYNTESFTCFSQSTRRLKEWVISKKLPDKVMERVKELYQKRKQFKAGFEIEGVHRTSNMADRLMDYQDRFLYKAKYFHSWNIGGLSKLYVRAIALVWNFHPYCKKVKRHSPFEDLNGFIYHKNWLQNMMVATSCGFYYDFSNRIR